MPKPDFLIIGAMKAATSTVTEYLEDHPDVHVPPFAEPRFFSRDENWTSGRDAYEALLTGGPGQIVGEGSNEYTFGALHPEAPARMAAYCPDAKLIYIVRDPLERIRSAWVQNRVDSGDAVPATLDAAVTEYPDRYVDPSLYDQQLARYREHFPEDQIWIGLAEDLRADPEAFWTSLCRFLGVAPHLRKDITHKQKNQSAGKHVPNARYSAVRRVPGYALAKAVVPRPLRHRAKAKLFSDKVNALPDFSPATRAEVLERVRPDAEALLARLGKPAETWNLH